MVELPTPPNEIILEILGHILPADFEHFAQTSIHIRTLSQGLLQKHRNLIRRHQGFFVAKDSGVVQALLGEVLLDPYIGHYVRKFEIRFMRESREIEPHMHLLSEAFSNSKYLAGNRPSLQEARALIQLGDDDVLLALLLPLLPNLASLTIRIQFARPDSWLHKTLQGIAKAEIQALPRLTHVNVQPIQGLGANKLKLLGALPSVTHLSVYRLTNESRFSNWMHPSPQVSISNVTFLDIWECKMGSNALCQSIQGFRSLQVFLVSASRRDTVTDKADPFDAQIIRSTLLDLAKNTLRKLTIIPNPHSQPQESMGPLHDFGFLEEVHSEWSCLFPMQSKDAHPDNWCSLLPRTLKSLEVVADDNLTAALGRKLIEDVSLNKSSMFPNFDELTFSANTRPLSENRGRGLVEAVLETRQMREKVGLSVTVIGSFSSL